MFFLPYTVAIGKLVSLTYFPTVVKKKKVVMLWIVEQMRFIIKNQRGGKN